MIDAESSLAEFLTQLEAAEWVALDIEADSLHSYPEKVCLIQIRIPDQDALIDPLASLDLAPMWKILKGKEIIMHGCDYDLRMLRRDFGFKPRQVFDTKEAARLVGLRQFSLANLVQTFEKVTLDKGSQKANWSLRPLTPAMEQYALNDIRYLQPVAARLKDRLNELNRLSWHRETCERLIKECSIIPEVDQDRVWRVKGSFHLKPKELAVLRALWKWREKQAIQRNQPPFYVLQHNKLVKIAQAAANQNGYHSLLPKRWSQRKRRSIQGVIDRALALPPSDYPKRLRNTNTQLPPVSPEKVEKLKKRRDARARDLDIDPTLIASRAMMEHLTRNWEANKNHLMKWQRELLEKQSPD